MHRSKPTERRGHRRSRLRRATLLLCAITFVALLSACATVEKAPKEVRISASTEAQKAAQQAVVSATDEKLYKRKIAVGRFSNETNYGRGLLVDESLDPLGKQASDILATQLTSTERFIIFERPDINKIKAEQELTGDSDLVGVDALIMGSVTEFGRATDGKTGFLSSTKKQSVRAKVNLRLVDVKTGHVFFGADGVGEAINESGEVAGFGSRAAYDSTLNERAIAAAISDVIGDLVTELERRRWRTYILSESEGQIYVSGGKTQGLRPGDELVAIKAGKKVKNPQNGMQIELPGQEVARLRVEANFGEDEFSEGSVCSVTSGSLQNVPLQSVYIQEPNE